MSHREMVCKLFDYFYSKIYKNPNFKLDLSINNQAKVVENFIKLLSNYYPLESLNVNFFITYFSFSFSYWHDKITRRKIALNWIIGKKTFKRFIETQDETQFFVDKFLDDYKVNINQLRQDLFPDHNEALELSGAEEIEKSRFKGEAQLYHCTQYTTLYNHKSKVCMRCSEKSTCKGVLKQMFPKLFVSRGYKKA